MPLYHTTLFSNDPPGEAFVARGAVWSFEKESGVYRGPPTEMHDYSMKLFEERGTRRPAITNRMTYLCSSTWRS
jgi:hypothetical protein